MELYCFIEEACDGYYDPETDSYVVEWTEDKGREMP